MMGMSEILHVFAGQGTGDAAVHAHGSKGFGALGQGFGRGLDGGGVGRTGADGVGLAEQAVDLGPLFGFEQVGIGQTEMMVRTIANCLKPAFRGLLKLVIAHADEPRTLQIKGEWVSYDPKVWNVDMDCMVNIGLGGGTKERDMAVLQVIYGLQKELLMTMGADNPFVKPDQLYNVLERITETAGFPSADPYFTKPDPQEVARRLQDAKNAPNPEMIKLQAQMQLEQAKLQQSAELEKMKAAAARDKEMAQMQADLQVKAAEGQRDSVGRQEELQAKAALEEQKLAFEREKILFEAEMRAKELAQQRELELLKLGAKDSASGIVSQEDTRTTQTLDAFRSMMTEMAANMNRPKRVIRDANGDSPQSWASWHWRCWPWCSAHATAARWRSP